MSAPRLSLAVAAALTLLTGTGCASPARDTEATAQLHWSEQVMTQCFKDQATQLDDHQSDASSVANAVVVSCNSEAMAVIKLGSHGLLPENYFEFERRMKASFVGLAEEVVLAERREGH
jgi:hypothetical protein